MPRSRNQRQWRVKQKVAEKDTLSAIRDYLEWHQIPYVRVQPMRPVHTKKGVVFGNIRKSQKGAPDLVILIDCDYYVAKTFERFEEIMKTRERSGSQNCFAIETKSATGVHAVAQKDWAKRLAKKRGI